MTIGFDDRQWARLAADAARWWRGDLDRPMVSLTLRPPATGADEYQIEYDPAQPVERLVDWWEERLAGEGYLGDAFPTVRPAFGPGCNAAFCGARPEVGEGTVWFHPDRERALAELPLEFDSGNVWWRRLLAIYRAAQQRWGRRVCLGMADLVPGLDVVQTFRPGAQLLLDLHDQPAVVAAQAARADAVFVKHLRAVHDWLAPANPGYTCWASMYSSQPYYMLQCDFSYMISPAMFAEFVLPGLRTLCRELPHAFYHLDGPGQLPHLDQLLAIPELRGIQWIPGAGAPDERHWPDVYRRIRAAGKLIQVYGTLETLDTITGQVGSARGLWLIGEGDLTEEPQLRRDIARFGVN